MEYTPGTLWNRNRGKRKKNDDGLLPSISLMSIPIPSLLSMYLYLHCYFCICGMTPFSIGSIYNVTLAWSDIF
jgi:hypothetical protein